jgi:hypothetical protein
MPIYLNSLSHECVTLVHRHGFDILPAGKWNVFYMGPKLSHLHVPSVFT